MVIDSKSIADRFYGHRYASRAYILYRWWYLYISNSYRADSTESLSIWRPRYSKHYSFCTLSSHLLVSMVIRRGVRVPCGSPRRLIVGIYSSGCTYTARSIWDEILPTFCICNCPANDCHPQYNVYHLCPSVIACCRKGWRRCKTTRWRTSIDFVAINYDRKRYVDGRARLSIHRRRGIPNPRRIYVADNEYTSRCVSTREKSRVSAGVVNCNYRGHGATPRYRAFNIFRLSVSAPAAAAAAGGQTREGWRKWTVPGQIPGV